MSNHMDEIEARFDARAARWRAADAARLAPRRRARRRWVLVVALLVVVVAVLAVLVGAGVVMLGGLL